VTKFHYSKLVNVKFLNLGGSRNERSKWKKGYEDVDAFIFVIALSQYNEFKPDDDFNKMIESLEELENIQNSLLSNFPWFLIFNKQDIFHKELSKESISICFPDCPNSLKQLIDPIFKKSLKIKESKTSIEEIINISELSEDELRCIFLFLDISSWIQLSGVNSTFHSILNSDALWRPICEIYNSHIDYNEVIKFYSPIHCSTMSPWKFYFFQKKIIYEQHLNFIVEQFKKKAPQGFKQFYVASAVDSSMDSVMDEIFNEIIKLGK
jgi:hypothetical protein